MIHGELEKNYDLDFLEQLKKIHAQHNICSSEKMRQLNNLNFLAPYEKIFDYKLPFGIVAVAYAAGYDSFKICKYPILEPNEHIRISNLLRSLCIAYQDVSPNKKIIYNYREGNLPPTCNIIFEDTLKKIYCDKNTVKLTKFPVTQIIIGNYVTDSEYMKKQNNGCNGVAETYVEYRECLILRDYT